MSQKDEDTTKSSDLRARIAAENIDLYHRRFEAGDGFSLMHAIRECSRHELPLPPWAAAAYIARFDRILTLRESSWDAVFGRPFPKGSHLKSARLRRELRPVVALRVDEIVAAEGCPIDDELFERVGVEFKIGKTLANELYYDAKRIFDSLPPSLEQAIKLLGEAPR
jgi:hypothetical protein